MNQTQQDNSQPIAQTQPADDLAQSAQPAQSTAQLSDQPPDQPSDQPPAQPPAQASAGVNPLDELEKLIANAQQKSDQSPAAAVQDPTQQDLAEQGMADQAEIQADEQKLAEIEQLKAQKKEEEKVLVQQQQQLIQQTVDESPEMKRRVEAKKEEVQQQKQDAVAGGFEIRQLEHTKIKKPAG